MSSNGRDQVLIQTRIFRFKIMKQMISLKTKILLTELYLHNEFFKRILRIVFYFLDYVSNIM
jgi:hypothetical protein